MGSYKSAVVTSAGESLIAQVLAGNKTITFSSAKTSSYAYPAGTNIKALTGLQDVVQTVMPFSAEVFSDVIVQVSSRFSNEDVSAEYPMNTIGIYAQAEGEAEQLFAVVQAITPYIMEAQSPTSPQGYIFNVQITVQQASQLTVTVNPAGTATVQDILDVKADIAAIENPEFDDSGNVSTITDYNSFYSSIVSKMSIFDFFRNLKAGLKYLVNVGQIVNNGTTNQAGFVMDARQANPDIQGTLANQISVLNSKTVVRYDSDVPNGYWRGIKSNYINSVFTLVYSPETKRLHINYTANDGTARYASFIPNLDEPLPDEQPK